MDINGPRRSRRIAGQPADFDFFSALQPASTKTPATLTTHAQPTAASRRVTRGNGPSYVLRTHQRPYAPTPTLRPAQRHPPPPDGPFTFEHSDPVWPLRREHQDENEPIRSHHQVATADKTFAEDVEMSDAPQIKQETPIPGIDAIAAGMVLGTPPRSNLRNMAPGDPEGASWRDVPPAPSRDPDGTGQIVDQWYRTGPQQLPGQTPETALVRTAIPPAIVTPPQPIPSLAPAQRQQPTQTKAAAKAAALPMRDPPMHECIVCCDTFEEKEMKQPCHFCVEWYCNECIADMFDRAIDTPSAMPPKCHMMIQLHIGLPLLSPERAENFCKTFEQWLAVDKVFCPVKTCSTFIPERIYHPGQGPAPKFSQYARLQIPRIVDLVIRHGLAQPFLTPPAATSRPNDRPQNLFAMRRIKYNSWTSFLEDLTRIMDNTQLPDSFPLADTKARLIAVAWKEFDNITLHFHNKISFPAEKPSIIACPTCSIGICLECREIAHAGKPCDTSKKDYELALMAQYGYKQCPVCKTAVKRMFGCSHMQCLCGAHWCWRCGGHIDECGGDCSDEDEEDASDYGEEEYVDGDAPTVYEAADPAIPALPMNNTFGGQQNSLNAVEGQQNIANAAGGQQDAVDIAGVVADVDSVAHSTAISAVYVSATTQTDQTEMANAATPAAFVQMNPGQHAPTPATVASVAPATAPARRPAHHMADLDAGGGGRWARNGNFGDEPNEPMTNVWTCNHQFKHAHTQRDHRTIKTGTIVQCNRCFKEMEVQRRITPSVGPSAKLDQVKMEPITVASSTAQEDLQRANERGGEGSDNDAPREDATAASPHRPMPGAYPQSFTSAKTELEKTKKQEIRKEDAPYDCRGCNILYCGSCKDIVIERRRIEKKR